MKILKELSNQVQVCLTQDFFYLINIIVQLNTKSLPNVYLVVNVFSDPLWTIDVQNLSMCNAAVNAFWSSARIDAEKKKKSKMRLRPPLQFTNFFNDTVYPNDV